MSVYNIGKLVDQTRKLCVEWHAQGKTTGMTGEVAAFDAAQALNLELCQDHTLGYTAIGTGERKDKKILVKGRAIFKEQKSRARLGQLQMDIDWDLLVLVLLDDKFEAQEIFEASRLVIEKEQDEQKTSKRKGSMTVAKFKRIATLVWTAKEGHVEEEIWNNQSSNT